MAQVERLRVYPVKGLDGIDVEATEVLSEGTMAYDREFALFDTDGNVLNGKRTKQVHALATDFDPESGDFTVETPGGEGHHFALENERERAEQWFSEFFGAELSLRQDTSLGFVDRREMGPSVITTATLRTVASWFDGMTNEGARRRFRANVEISGVSAFWEDRFVGSDAPEFDVDGVRFEGATPCGRCVVPQRNPDTGDPIPEFRERFLRKRQETIPDWVDDDAFEHYYALTIIARIPDTDRGRTLRVGGPVSVLD